MKLGLTVMRGSGGVDQHALALVGSSYNHEGLTMMMIMMRGLGLMAVMGRHTGQTRRAGVWLLLRSAALYR